MRQEPTGLIILSVYSKWKEPTENLLNHADTFCALEDKYGKGSVLQGEGCYNGCTEDSIIVLWPGCDQNILAHCVAVADTFKQESILLVSPDRKAELLELEYYDAVTGVYSTLPLGQFTELDTIDGVDNYTVVGTKKWGTK